MFSYIRRIRTKICCIYNKFKLKSHGIAYGYNLIVTGSLIIKKDKGSISIGDNVTIHSGKYDIPIGYPQRTSFWILGNGKINIGNNCGLSNCSICSLDQVSIGNNVLLGGGVKIYDTDFHSVNWEKRRNIFSDNDRKAKPVIIQDDVFIGAGTTILKGTTIGSRSIIGAGSIVSGTIPADEIWAGNPARRIRGINNEDNVDNKC